LTGQDKKPIPFFTDNDVEDAVGDFLRSCDHEVTRLRDVMLSNSADPVVDANCRENGLVLITHNYKHFRKIARELQMDGRIVKRLNRIDMEIHQSEGPRRMSEVLHLIEAEWEAGRGIQASICKAIIRIYR
jgi:predicted nuclease of predicted toxin-antitoxin system